ncbi:hypothetical protein GYMLUDRAFT_51959 [Collybiopsis luxurians FD-317 M1]|nr:hypothetical protein GYMLUDRAFT_51959 [Collybiopsis luxurians FD-317 M1]
MSSALPPARSESSRNWWPLSSKSSGKDLASSYSSEKSGRDSSSKKDGTKLTSFMGFKSKKHPSLAIQDPPITSPSSPVDPPLSPSPSSKYTNRPSSKSVSSTRSRVESMEPRTPLDGQRDTAVHRNSLLTLSDADPFASRGMALPHSPVDPNRLSAYSGSSVVPEYFAKRLEDKMVSRISYASSSSHSNLYSDEVSSLSPTSSIYITENPKRTLSHKKSLGDVSHKSHRLQSHVSPPGMIKSNSSVTLTDTNRLSHPDLASTPRPPMRARGLTDAAALYHRTNFLQNERSIVLNTSSPPLPPSVSSPVSPRVIVRQPSVQRMGLPVSAPPNQQLPPPPTAVNIEDEDVDPLRFSNSASSSSTSLRSSRDGGLANQHYIPRQKARESGVRPAAVEDLTESLHKARTLKKAVSQQSLSKAASSTSISVTTQLPPENAPDKGPRKQRSFHHPRIPLPPMPLSLKHQSSGSAATSDGAESKRASVGSPTPSRKRLFSGSSMRRPSTSQESVGDDDFRSVFSVEREKPSSFSPKTAFSTTKSSFWDEGYSDTLPGSPTAVSTFDYTPQQIMSPAEMLKLEAVVQKSLSSSRPREISRGSTSTFASNSNSASSTPIAPRLLNPQPSPTRSNSMGSGGVVTPRLPRPSTANSLTLSTMNNTLSPDFVSLSPPPRSRSRRPQPTLDISSLTPEAPLKALSPPPRNKTVTKKLSSEKVDRRSSLMRKPSFLDIDDDATFEKSRPPPVPPAFQADSFLDLARESLDSARSEPEDEQF